jgi:uncharacterized protein (DUF934 family)
MEFRKIGPCACIQAAPVPVRLLHDPEPEVELLLQGLKNLAVVAVQFGALGPI